MPEVEFEANGAKASGYLAEPEGEGPGLVVLQEWWGVDKHIRDVCERFGSEGFVALAPDLFHGETTDQPDEAQQKMMALNMEEAEKEMRGAVDYVAQLPKCTGQVGTVGFCLGGGLSIWTATVNDKVDAAVTFYYVMPHGKPDFAKLAGTPVLGHFGDNDDFVSTEDAKALQQELNQAGAEAIFHFYEGAGHAFFNDLDRLGTHHPEHAATAWDRTVDFFRRHLNGGDPEIERVG
jgi:carboxymethylenebutenolidase